MLYHLFAISKRTGKRTQMTETPCTFVEGMTILGKLSAHPARTLKLEIANACQ